MLRRWWCALRGHPWMRVTITEVVLDTGTVRQTRTRTSCDHCGVTWPGY